jgi:hypothetical protein
MPFDQRLQGPVHQAPDRRGGMGGGEFSETAETVAALAAGTSVPPR